MNIRLKIWKCRSVVCFLLAALFSTLGTACTATEENHLPKRMVQTYFESLKTKDYVVSLVVEQTAISDEETARITKMYAGSELAEKNGWTDAYLAENMIAIYVKYTVDYDNTKVPYNEGRLEQYFYLIRADKMSEWAIWDMSAPSDIP